MKDEMANYIQEDEIDLRELFDILMRKKILILVITSIVTILATIYVYMKTPIYEVKSNIQVGFIGKELIAEPSVLVKTLKIVFNVEDKISSDEVFSAEVTDVSLVKGLENFITVKTQAISNAEALAKNKELVLYVENKYLAAVEQYKLNNLNKIDSVKGKIANLDNLEIKNLQRDIELLKTQRIVKIDEKIKFYKKTKIDTLTKKIQFHTSKLEEYTKAVKQIYQNNKENRDTTSLTISSLQMVNYQNLILNSQNKVEDLKIEIEKISNEVIPNLQREKKNIQNDTLRKLTYKLKVELPNKRDTLLKEIERFKFQSSDLHIQNSKVVGEYVVRDYPVAPKKKLIVVVAFITGLILSIFLVFFLNFISVLRDKSDSKYTTPEKSNNYF